MLGIESAFFRKFAQCRHHHAGEKITVTITYAKCLTTTVAGCSKSGKDYTRIKIMCGIIFFLRVVQPQKRNELSGLKSKRVTQGGAFEFYI